MLRSSPTRTATRALFDAGAAVATGRRFGDQGSLQRLPAWASSASSILGVVITMRVSSSRPLRRSRRRSPKVEDQTGSTWWQATAGELPGSPRHDVDQGLQSQSSLTPVASSAGLYDAGSFGGMASQDLRRRPRRRLVTAGQYLKYLAPYVHRVAISDQPHRRL